MNHGSRDLRVGLVGWSCRSGLGQLNADLARLCPWISVWLVPEHPLLGIDSNLLIPGKSRLCAVSGDDAIYTRFLDDIDVVLFAERQYVKDGFSLAREARARGKLVCTIPMMEFLPDGEPFLEHVDLMWAPTRWSRHELRALAERREQIHRLTDNPCWRTPWAAHVAGGRYGVDLSQFEFRQRTRCEGFLFVNGRGGRFNRKGGDIVARAAALAPEIPLRVHSQVDLPAMPSHVKVSQEDLSDRAGLYAEGDLLIAPSRWEGLGNQHYEAQACGLPVLTTDAPPMNECGGRRVAIQRVDSLKFQRPLVSHEVHPEDLASAMRALHGEPIGGMSRAARARIERHHDLRDVAEGLRAAIEMAWSDEPATVPTPRLQAVGEFASPTSEL